MRKIIKLTTETAIEAEQKLKENDGYCPCAIEKKPATKCMCREFRMHTGDPTWYGKCHCGLYEVVDETE